MGVRDLPGEISERKCNTAHSDAEPRLLYDRRTAARQLSISIRSLDYLIQQQRIATRRIGSRVLVSYDELRRFARGNHTDPIVAA
jgi:hypothetical protein